MSDHHASAAGSPRVRAALLLSAVGTLGLSFFALLTSVVAPLDCRSCTESQLRRFEADYDVGTAVVTTGVALGLGLLLAARADTRTRGAALALAATAPLPALCACLVFRSLVNAPQ